MEMRNGITPLLQRIRPFVPTDCQNANMSSPVPRYAGHREALAATLAGYRMKIKARIALGQTDQPNRRKRQTKKPTCIPAPIAPVTLPTMPKRSILESLKEYRNGTGSALASSLQR